MTPDGQNLNMITTVDKKRKEAIENINLAITKLEQIETRLNENSDFDGLKSEVGDLCNRIVAFFEGKIKEGLLTLEFAKKVDDLSTGGQFQLHLSNVDKEGFTLNGQMAAGLRNCFAPTIGELELLTTGNLEKLDETKKAIRGLVKFLKSLEGAMQKSPSSEEKEQTEFEEILSTVDKALKMFRDIELETKQGLTVERIKDSKYIMATLFINLLNKFTRSEDLQKKKGRFIAEVFGDSHSESIINSMESAFGDIAAWRRRPDQMPDDVLQNLSGPIACLGRMKEYFKDNK